MKIITENQRTSIVIVGLLLVFASVAIRCGVADTLLTSGCILIAAVLASFLPDHH